MQNYGERVRKPDILMIRVILRREKIPMVDKVIENNRVSIVGEIVSDFRYSHQVYGEGFYIVDVAVSRLSESGRCDGKLHRPSGGNIRTVPFL